MIHSDSRPAGQHRASSKNTKSKDLNIPLGFSSQRVNVLPDLVIASVSQHRPDDADHVATESTDRLVVGLALGTLAVVVRAGLGYALHVSSHCGIRGTRNSGDTILNYSVSYSERSWVLCSPNSLSSKGGTRMNLLAGAAAACVPPA